MMTRGDLLEITWVDITEDSTGDPNVAALSKRISFGFFWAEVDSLGIPSLITTMTRDEDVEEQAGWCIYPKCCILSIEVIKRKRQRKKKNVP